MARTFTPSQRAAIASARKSGTPISVIAKRFHTAKANITELCREEAAAPKTATLTPPPYATGYRTAVYGVCNSGPTGALTRYNLSWGKSK